MIAITHLDGKRVVLNADLVESLEAMPDTVITLTSGKRVIVREGVDEIVEKVAAYKRKSQDRASLAGA